MTINQLVVRSSNKTKNIKQTLIRKTISKLCQHKEKKLMSLIIFVEIKCFKLQNYLPPSRKLQTLSSRLETN